MAVWGVQMREIKFRAWDTEFNMMGLVSVLDIEAMRVEAVTEDMSYYDFLNFTLMQYTGLKDKNGVEIYEGDVVRHFVHEVPEPILKQILYFEGSFIAKPSYYEMETYMSLINFSPYRTMEVIGNIYENPELLVQNES